MLRRLSKLKDQIYQSQNNKMGLHDCVFLTKKLFLQVMIELKFVTKWSNVTMFTGQKSKDLFNFDIKIFGTFIGSVLDPIAFHDATKPDFLSFYSEMEFKWRSMS